MELKKTNILLLTTLVIITGFGIYYFSSQGDSEEVSLNSTAIKSEDNIILNNSLQDLDIKDENKDLQKGEQGEDTEGKDEELIEKFVKYKIEFIARWSSKTHPNYYPVNAHFSPFVAYSHNNTLGAMIFKKGGEATVGVEDMAETGATQKLNKEIDEIISKKIGFKKTQGNVFNSPGTSSSEIELSNNYRYLTFVSMLAPSPDWFISVTENLLIDGRWLDSVEFNLITYDAGSDSGENLTSLDRDTKPKESIKIFSDNLQGLGKIILTKITK